MAVLPGVLGCWPLRRTVRVRLGTNTLRLPGGTTIFVVSRQQLKLPAACCRESSKWKVLRPFYCSSLANSVAKTCRRAQVVSLKSCRYGGCARESIFMKYTG
ncbi:MAG: hypothetical protein LJE87_17420 [Deltaproteobacteria bacterium]|nr:hypothetical protein [Deltaproteobacteria bacterium]